jgi:hypothetical protein
MSCDDEAEANCGLLFLGDKFAIEARDLDLSFDTIKALSKRYENSILSTLWPMVEDRGRNSSPQDGEEPSRRSVKSLDSQARTSKSRRQAAAAANEVDGIRRMCPAS